MRQKPKPTEDERQALIEKWDRPSPNPRYRGMTPREVARTLARRPAKKVVADEADSTT